MPLVNQTQTDLHRIAMFDWFAARSGLGASKVIWADQNTPRKGLPAGVIQIISRGKKIGEDYVQEILNTTSGLVERTYLGLRRMMVQFDIYTAPRSDDTTLGALELLEQALAALSMRQVIDQFQVANLAALDYEIINAPDVMVGERWEKRAIADVEFSYRTILFDDGTDAAPDDGQYIKTIDDITEANSTVNWFDSAKVFSPEFSNDFS